MVDSLNLDFEFLDSKKFPLGWTYNKKIAISPIEQESVFIVDSNISYHGRYSFCINKEHFPSDIFTSKKVIALPRSGSKIVLRGFIRTENVTGFAGLWMRVDGDNGPIAMDNMMRKNLQGSNDWKEYSIALNYNSNQATRVSFGGIIAGSGKLWIDDLHIIIDDSEISVLPNFAKTESLFAHQNDSSINNRQITDLARLGCLWGFLKYHHQKFTSGSYDADKELLRLLDLVRSSKNSRETDLIFMRWLDSLGVPIVPILTKSREMSIADTLHSRCKPTYSFLFDGKYFDKDIVDRIKKILNGMDCANGQYYVSRKGIVANFQNENPYTHIITPDWNLRLLALFRYWNAIEYFYPYRYLIPEWQTKLFDYVEIFYKALSSSDYVLACQKLACEIQDSHSLISPSYMHVNGQINLLPIKISFIQHIPVVDEIYVSSPSDSILSLIHRGDIVSKINDVEIDSLIQKYLPLTSGSNLETKFRDISENYLLRTSESTMSITLQTKPSSVRIVVPTVSVDRYYESRFRLAETEKIRVIEDSICYIPLPQFDLAHVHDLLKNCEIKRVIVDMRKPFSRDGIFDSLEVFIGEYAVDVSPYCVFTGANFCYPGYFPIFLSNRLKVTSAVNEPRCPIKLIVLVDENTQSARECLTMALQCIPNSITIGNKTAGADGNITSLILPGNINMIFSGLGVYYPDGKETQRIGIQINKHVDRTIVGIKQGRDELLEAAKRN